MYSLSFFLLLLQYRYCAIHRSPGMNILSSGKCMDPSCSIRPTYLMPTPERSKVDFISDSVLITWTVLVLTKYVLDYCIDELPIVLHGLSTTTKQRHHNSLPASTSLSSCPPFSSDVLLRSEKIEVNSDQSKFWSIFRRLPFRAFLVNFWLDGLFLPSNLFILMDSSILVRTRLLYPYTVWIFFLCARLHHI